MIYHSIENQNYRRFKPKLFHNPIIYWAIILDIGRQKIQIHLKKVFKGSRRNSPVLIIIFQKFKIVFIIYVSIRSMTCMYFRNTIIFLIQLWGLLTRLALEVALVGNMVCMTFLKGSPQK